MAGCTADLLCKHSHYLLCCDFSPHPLVSNTEVRLRHVAAIPSFVFNYGLPKKFSLLYFQSLILLHTHFSSLLRRA